MGKSTCPPSPASRGLSLRCLRHPGACHPLPRWPSWPPRTLPGACPPQGRVLGVGTGRGEGWRFQGGRRCGRACEGRGLPGETDGLGGCQGRARRGGGGAVSTSARALRGWKQQARADGQGTGRAAAQECRRGSRACLSLGAEAAGRRIPARKLSPASSHKGPRWGTHELPFTGEKQVAAEATTNPASQPEGGWRSGCQVLGARAGKLGRPASLRGPPGRAGLS